MLFLKFDDNNKNNKTLFKHRQLRDCCHVHGCVHTLTFSPLYRPVPPALGSPFLRLKPPSYSPPTTGLKRPRSPIAIAQQTSIQSPTHKPMTLHSKPDPTMITNHFCACGLFSKWNIQQNYFVFVEFWTTFFRVSTCFNGSAAAMDAQLGFGTRLRWFCDRGVW